MFCGDLTFNSFLMRQSCSNAIRFNLKIKVCVSITHQSAAKIFLPEVFFEEVDSDGFLVTLGEDPAAVALDEA